MVGRRGVRGGRRACCRADHRTALIPQLCKYPEQRPTASIFAQRIHPIRIIMGKISILGEFWQFLKVRKKFWLAPILVVLLLLSLVIVLAQGSALAPFIYALF